jgi:hypothetical protein
MRRFDRFLVRLKRLPHLFIMRMCSGIQLVLQLTHALLSSRLRSSQWRDLHGPFGSNLLRTGIDSSISIELGLSRCLCSCLSSSKQTTAECITLFVQCAELRVKFRSRHGKVIACSGEGGVWGGEALR